MLRIVKKLTLLYLFFCGWVSLSFGTVIHVDADAIGNLDGTSWGDAYADLKEALANSNSGDEIWIAEGTYYPTQTDNPFESFSIPCGVSLFGGFSGNEVSRSERNWKEHETVLSGEIGDLLDNTDNSNFIILIDNCVDSVVLSGLILEGGYTTGSSSVIAISDSENVEIRQCIIRDNIMQNGIQVADSEVMLSNSLFTNNTFEFYAITQIGISGTLEVMNVTVADNSSLAFFSQGNFTSPPMEVHNSVFWNNDGSPTLGSVASVVTNSIVQGGGAIESADNVTDVDPLFVDPVNGDYQLQAGSPAEDAGNQSFISQGYDLARSYRIMGTEVDMGCYERRIPTVLYVDQDAQGANVGVSWQNAFTNLTEALDFAITGDELWIAEGTYVAPGNVGFNLINKGLRIFGGFEGTETQRNQRDWFTHRTILSGNIGDPADPTDNADHVFYILVNNEAEGEVVLNGLEFEEGYANSSLDLNGEGAGLVIVNANEVTVRNCTFRNNFAQDAGGAIYVRTSDEVLISQCVFTNNTSPVGGALCTESQPADNPRICDIQSCLFDGNTAFNTGIVYLNDNDEVALTNCTFYANGVSFTPDAKIIDGDATDESWVFANNILWQNSILGANQEILDAGPNSIVANSILQNAYSGNATNVFNLDPQFVDPSAGDFSLAQDSPAINNGDGSYVQENLDLLRQPRVLNGAVDLGAIENEIIVDGVIYVDQDATGNNDGSSWSNAFNEVGDAVDASQPGNQIWIAEGIYTPEAPNFQPWQLENDVDIIGGFQGIEWEVSSADPAQYETVISGDIGLDGDTSNDEMAMMQMFDLSSFVKISGLIFEEMNNTGANMNPVCFFNTSQAAVGSIGEVLFERCVFRDSQLGSEQFVGAQGSSASPIILQMDNCLIGGGISNDAFLLTLAGSIVLRMNHCTMNYNSSNVAIFAGSTTPIEINNSILWNEQGVNVWSNSVFFDVVVNSSILPSTQVNFEGENNLTQNPIFWNPAAGDFRLQPASPGVNSGNNNFTTMDLDLAGNERIQGGTVDRGCYESDYADVCPGDFDSNGLINSADLLVFLASYGTVCDQSTCQEDLTGDGTVNVADLLELLGVYGNACDDLVNQ